MCARENFIKFKDFRVHGYGLKVIYKEIVDYYGSVLVEFCALSEERCLIGKKIFVQFRCKERNS